MKAARIAIPQAPPSLAVSITVIGAFMPAAMTRCPTTGVLKKPPWPIRESTATCSSFNRMSMPIFRVATALYRWERMKFASEKSASGVLTTMGRPASSPVMGSPEK